MLLPIAYEGEGRDGYRDQIVTCDVGLSLHSKTHPLFMKYSKGSTQCYAYIALSELVSCTFSTIPICPIACLLLLLRQPRIEFPNVRGEYIL